MNKKEKALKNTILDILEDYETIMCILNKGQSISAKKGAYDSSLNDVRDIKVAFRDITLINEEEH